MSGLIPGCLIAERKDNRPKAAEYVLSEGNTDCFFLPGKRCGMRIFRPHGRIVNVVPLSPLAYGFMIDGILL
jgi:hypothetical protein